jgi:hypothetical protein
MSGSPPTPPLHPPTHDEVIHYRDTFRRELDKRMDSKHPSASPSTEAHEIALRQFIEARNKASTARSETKAYCLPCKWGAECIAAQQCLLEKKLGGTNDKSIQPHGVSFEKWLSYQPWIERQQKPLEHEDCGRYYNSDQMRAAWEAGAASTPTSATHADIYAACLFAVQGERLADPVPDSEGDIAYDKAVRDCEQAILALRERALADRGAKA